jgi:membrane-associated HD superfamily phosphohydrolase
LPGNANPHDKLDPVTSAQTIIRHVPDGIELARKYRLPRRIHDFILEHHGAMRTRYQYAKALEAAGGDESKVDEDQFRYPGPRPKSRETAILMLADGSEARIRAERPTDENELRKVIKSVIENRLSSGQLDETDLTLRDLDELIDSFTTTLRGIYHPRLEYPDTKKLSPVKKEEVPTVPIISRKSSDITANPPTDS